MIKWFFVPAIARVLSGGASLGDMIVGYLLCGGAFIFFTGMNYYRLYLVFIKKPERIPSPAPFLGGISGAILMIAIFGFKKPLLILLPFIIDPGSIPLIIEFVFLLISDNIKGIRHKNKDKKSK